MRNWNRSFIGLCALLILVALNFKERKCPSPRHSLISKSSDLYVIISVSFSNHEALSYVFNVPITIRIWKSIGVRSFIIIVGTENEWRKGPAHVALKEMKKFDPIIKFLDVSQKNKVLLTQVALNFGPCLLDDKHGISGSDILVSSGSDNWPIGTHFYGEILDNARYNLDTVTVTNAYCCGTFLHNNKSFRMVSNVHIIATFDQWTKLSGLDISKCKKNPEKYILERIIEEFGVQILSKDASKLDNLEVWYTDQKIVSIWLEKLRKKRENSVNLISHPGIVIDRAYWVVPDDLDDVFSAHGYDSNAYQLTQISNVIDNILNSNLEFCVLLKIGMTITGIANNLLERCQSEVEITKKLMEEEKKKDADYIHYVVVVLCLLLYIIIAIIIWKKYAKYCNKCDPMEDDPEQAKFERKMSEGKEQIETALSDKSITVGDKILGKGKFGMVYEATVKLKKHSGLFCVKKSAVKINNPKRSDILSMVEEALKLQNVAHENVVKLYGIYYSLIRPMIVMEYLDGGNLEEYFANQRGTFSICLGKIPKFHRMDTKSVSFIANGSLDEANYSQQQAPSFHDIHRILTQVAKALNYMHSLNPPYLHRDIAPRNIMLTTPLLFEAQAKLTDFGLVQDLQQDVYIRISKELLPFDRLSPEVFRQKLYGKSADVWQFGVLIWESVSLGDIPHKGKAVEEVARLVANSEDSNRCLPDVPFTPTPIQLLMHQCWKCHPQERPSFNHVVMQLDNSDNIIELSRKIVPFVQDTSMMPKMTSPLWETYYAPNQHDMTPTCTLLSNEFILPHIIISPFDDDDDQPTQTQERVQLNSFLSPQNSYSQRSGVWSTMNGYGIPRSGATSLGPVSLYVSSKFPSFDSGIDSCGDETRTVDQQPPLPLAPCTPSTEVVSHYVNVTNFCNKMYING